MAVEQVFGGFDTMLIVVVIMFSSILVAVVLAAFFFGIYWFFLRYNIKIIIFSQDALGNTREIQEDCLNEEGRESYGLKKQS